MPYPVFEPVPTRSQAKCHNHRTRWSGNWPVFELTKLPQPSGQSGTSTRPRWPSGQGLLKPHHLEERMHISSDEVQCPPVGMYPHIF
ncbi:hypothetical protein TNCV_3252741 [Trichonephila clavipes]|nr:hypothetical protein TNCV_3252741 [Trichonephila clavipes]